MILPCTDNWEPGRTGAWGRVLPRCGSGAPRQLSLGRAVARPARFPVSAPLPSAPPGSRPRAGEGAGLCGGRAGRRQGWAEEGLAARGWPGPEDAGVSARRAGPGGKAVRGWQGGVGPIPTRRGTFELPPAPERRALADTASFRPGLRRSMNGGRGGRSCYHTAPVKGSPYLPRRPY